MIKIFFILLYITLQFYSFSQNLVLNAGFEEYHTEPYFYTKLDSFFCYDWYNSLESTPDFFTTEATIGEFRLPYNSFGKVLPYSGESCIGMLLAISLR